MDYLTECNQGLTTNDQFSTQTDILYDVPHGFILGSLLLNQFLCDMIIFNNNTNFTRHATGTTTDCLGKNLEEVVTNLKISFRINFKWFENMKANPDKCNLLMTTIGSFGTKIGENKCSSTRFQ